MIMHQNPTKTIIPTHRYGAGVKQSPHPVCCASTSPALQPASTSSNGSAALGTSAAAAADSAASDSLRCLACCASPQLSACRSTNASYAHTHCRSSPACGALASAAAAAVGGRSWCADRTAATCSNPASGSSGSRRWHSIAQSLAARKLDSCCCNLRRRDEHWSCSKRCSSCTGREVVTVTHKQVSGSNNGRFTTHANALLHRPLC